MCYASTSQILGAGNGEIRMRKCEVSEAQLRWCRSDCNHENRKFGKRSGVLENTIDNHTEPAINADEACGPSDTIAEESITDGP